MINERARAMSELPIVRGQNGVRVSTWLCLFALCIARISAAYGSGHDSAKSLLAVSERVAWRTEMRPRPGESRRLVSRS